MQTVAPMPPLMSPMLPPYEYASVNAGGLHTCGVRADDGTSDAGTVECWGDNSAMQSAAPTGTTFDSVSAGSFHTCGVKTNKTVECWGDRSMGQSTPPTGTTFDSVSAGDGYTCGLREDGTVQCWGKYAYSP